MIFPIDSSGVALASIQALSHRMDDLEQENRELRARLARLEPGRRVAAKTARAQAAR